MVDLYNLSRLMLTLLVLCNLVLCNPVYGTDFSSAQTAANEGRYDDVVSILTELLQGELSEEEKVVAYSNRGIAYSLIEAYGLAKQDLEFAIKLSPEHALTQNHLGVLAEHVDGDYEKAVDWYRQAADQGFSAAQTNLADLLRSGRYETGSEEGRYATVLDLYQRATAQNFAMAFAPLGVMYRDGLGVAVDDERSIELFNQGVEHGDLAAHYQLGFAYELGRGVPRNYLQAAAYYRKAAEHGHVDAQNALGYLYRRGAGVSQDYAEAVKWYQAAADQGHDQAMNRLAWILATCPSADFCNGAKAVQLARQAVEFNSEHGYIDTLAASEARQGNFDTAIQLTRDLIGQFPEASPNHRKYQARLKRYEAGEPIQL